MLFSYIPEWGLVVYRSATYHFLTIQCKKFGKLGRKVPGSAAGALSKLVPRGSTSATDPSEDDTHDSTEPPVSNDDSDEEPSSDDDVYKRRHPSDALQR